MQSNIGSKSGQRARGWVGFLVAFAVLVAILSALFYKSFQPGVIAFSNDGPLGVQISEPLALPSGFNGFWLSLHWIGINAGFAFASITFFLNWMLGPVGYAKFYEPISLILLGASAWAFFRSIGVRSSLCVIGAIAAALNGNYFSNACWGLGSRAICQGCIFLALAALSARRRGNPWLNAVLAGFAVGMAVIEGADNGVIFSLYVSAFVIFQSFVEGSSWPGRTVKSLRLVLVGGFALFIAAQVLLGMFTLASKGSSIDSTEPDAAEKKWIFATQWSLPPAETLRVIIPGLYGYRMDAPDSGIEKVYWGRVGEFAPNPEVARRFSGSGEYAGLLVVLLAIWAVAVSFSKSLPVFTPKEKKHVWFWAVVVFVSILLSWGRFVPLFYKIIYSLPYLSSIRNPMKYMHPAHMGLLVLFGYGLLGLSRRYLEKPSSSLPVGQQMKSWWTKAAAFEKRWVWSLVGIVGLSLVGFMFYSASKTDLVKHLMAVGYPDEGQAQGIAGYSIYEVGLYFVWLLVSFVALLLIMGGVFSGDRSRWAALLLGLVLTVDLARADMPWIVHWNYKYKYQTNAIVDFLRAKPYEGRVVAPGYLADERAMSAAGGYNHLFPSLYAIEWVQQHFQFYNIQTIDIAQDPRPPADKEAYMKAIRDPGRYWQLTNTRYVLGMAGFLDPLNQQLDKGRGRFRIATRFALEAKPGVQPHKLEDITAVLASNGPLAVFEFTGALPRASLYSRWQVSTNDTETLRTLADPAFDPTATVLVSDEIPPPVATTNGAAGTVEITSYKPTRVEIQARAAAPCVLLLNDRFDNDWRVTVDGRSAKILRANFIMRGVQLTPGDHKIVFTFQPALTGFKVSLIAVGLALALCSLLFFVRQGDAAITPAAPAEKPARK
jgi:hypothetical protein